MPVICFPGQSKVCCFSLHLVSPLTPSLCCSMRTNFLFNEEISSFSDQCHCFVNHFSVQLLKLFDNMGHVTVWEWLWKICQQEGFWMGINQTLIQNQMCNECKVFLAAIACGTLHNFPLSLVFHHVAPVDATWNTLLRLLTSVCYEWQVFTVHTKFPALIGLILENKDLIFSYHHSSEYEDPMSASWNCTVLEWLIFKNYFWTGWKKIIKCILAWKTEFPTL